MASENFVQPAIPCFDGHYDHWGMLTENFLRSKEYWQVVSDGIPELTAAMTDAQKTDIEGMKLKDLKAKNYLFQAIDRSILETILCKDTSKQIWDSMKKKYEGSAKAKRQQLQTLRTEFENLKMKSGESIAIYFSRVMTITNKMRMFKDKSKDIIIIEKILRSLTPKFNFVVCAMEESKDIDELSLDELQSSLLEVEAEVKRRETTTNGISSSNNETINLKQEEKVGDKEAITLHLINENLKTNLLSVGQLQEKGYKIVIKNGVCRVQDEKLGLIAQVNMTSNRMFPLYLQSLTHSCFSAKVNDEAWLWHFRYGHLHFGGLKTLQQKNRDSFSKGKSWRAKQVLELIHSDLCGPIDPISNGGKRYFVTFIDDYSRKTWVYFLQEKSETFSTFKNFKAKVEKEAGMSIKILRSDRGGEYNSQEFENFCEEYGIKRQLTAAYTPQQNGVSERKNRTIMNMVRSMLKSSGVQKNCWPEAVKWSIHVLNRSPTFSVQDQTPEEAWSGRKPSVEHFRIFGCIAYAHVPDPKRSKLDDKGEKCIFLGVCEKSKAYKLYSPITKKVFISRDVFNEAEFWNHEKCKPEQRIQVDFEDGDEATSQQVETNNEVVDTPEIPPVGAVERAQRVKQRPAWMQDYVVTGIDQSDDPVVHFALFSDCDPVAFEEAVKKPKWREAMNNEIAVIERNNTWELTKLPKGQKAIDVKWVYKTKLNEKGELDKYKARLVAKGYKQEFDVDYKEVFAPVARHDTIRLVIALAAQNSWPIFQLDVKSAFLHGELQEKVFIKQPPGYVKLECENMVYRLKKALYGLKQAPRTWYSRIETYFLREGFQKCLYEHTLFVKLGKDGKMLIVCLYVDDLIYTKNDAAMFEIFKQSMMLEFDMSDLGKMHYFLGLEVVQSPSGIFISQRKYLQDVLMSDYAGDIDDRKRTSGYVVMLGSGAVSWSSKKQSIVTLSTTEAKFIAATSCACQAIWFKQSMGVCSFNEPK
ncbi:UNVERIFIED_CONTAM: Retrovirus-related Pol polyprotein from transposon TNT 1-94 [Sesamum angustifolium]|uniref:Retrovirus-related Pol polyprotein from transposon TNT 1-94 n=1 Tax=Sesamum angustifolium TaxID=2727405 RepID=A0AAW2J238_9LAMI